MVKGHENIFKAFVGFKMVLAKKAQRATSPRVNGYIYSNALTFVR